MFLFSLAPLLFILCSCIITMIPSMSIESFLFFFKGNQEAANEQLLERFKGICCLTLKKYFYSLFL